MYTRNSINKKNEEINCRRSDFMAIIVLIVFTYVIAGVFLICDSFINYDLKYFSINSVKENIKAVSVFLLGVVLVITGVIYTPLYLNATFVIVASIIAAIGGIYMIAQSITSYKLNKLRTIFLAVLAFCAILFTTIYCIEYPSVAKYIEGDYSSYKCCICGLSADGGIFKSETITNYYCKKHYTSVKDYKSSDFKYKCGYCGTEMNSYYSYIDRKYSCYSCTKAIKKYKG